MTLVYLFCRKNFYLTALCTFLTLHAFICYHCVYLVFKTVSPSPPPLQRVSGLRPTFFVSYMRCWTPYPAQNSLFTATSPDQRKIAGVNTRQKPQMEQTCHKLCSLFYTPLISSLLLSSILLSTILLSTIFLSLPLLLSPALTAPLFSSLSSPSPSL